ncbi:MAG: phage terminase large subunit [Clostridium sp.]|nr:phage terminase large subunit [Clostridium sp.]
MESTKPTPSPQPIYRDFSKCPRCKNPTKKCTAISGTPSEYWLECTNPGCNTYINTYIPQEHQVAVHKDSTLIKGNFGGYGSGKTTTSREELYKHIFITPSGTSLVGANVTSQFEQTIKRDIEYDLPKDFIAASSAMKAFYDFQNGHRLLFRPFDDVDKIRSYNLTFFLIIEASECKKEVYTQLKTRLRNTAAGVQKKDKNGDPVFKNKNGQMIPVMLSDWRNGVIESNPDSGWIRTDVVLKAGFIHKHGQIHDDFYVDPKDRDPFVSVHITTSDVNAYLPDNFVEQNSQGKTMWWIQKYLYGSFQYAAGLVYPNAINHVIEDFQVPKHWKRLVAYDYGLSDDSVYLLAAIDEEKGQVIIYDEYVTNNKNIAELAAAYFEITRDIPSGGMVGPPIIDPKSGSKRDYDKKALADHFLDYNIAFKPGAINKDARVFRTNTYIELGYLKIMRKCKYLINQLREYKFKTEGSDEQMFTDKPVDKNDHAIVCLEWILMELPADPRNLVYGIYNKDAKDLTLSDNTKKEQEYAVWFFEDTDDNEDSFMSPVFD